MANGGMAGPGEREGRGDRVSGARLARSYLGVRAEQSAEAQPRGGGLEAARSVRLPRLDRTHLNSPEAQAQYRLGLLARLAARGEAWFTLAARTPSGPNPGRRRA